MPKRGGGISAISARNRGRSAIGRIITIGSFDERGLGLVLEQRPVALERGRELRRVVAVPETAPRDEVGCGRDHRRRVELQERQPVDDLEQVARPLRVQQLRADRDPARLSSGDLPHWLVR